MLQQWGVFLNWVWSPLPPTPCLWTPCKQLIPEVTARPVPSPLIHAPFAWLRGYLSTSTRWDYEFAISILTGREQTHRRNIKSISTTHILLLILAHASMFLPSCIHTTWSCFFPFLLFYISLQYYYHIYNCNNFRNNFKFLIQFLYFHVMPNPSIPHNA